MSTAHWIESERIESDSSRPFNCSKCKKSDSSVPTLLFRHFCSGPSVPTLLFRLFRSNPSVQMLRFGFLRSDAFVLIRCAVIFRVPRYNLMSITVRQMWSDKRNQKRTVRHRQRRSIPRQSLQRWETENGAAVYNKRQHEMRARMVRFAMERCKLILRIKICN